MSRREQSGAKGKPQDEAPPTEQDTRKISASQLAEVLARVDGKRRVLSDPPGDPKDRLAAVERPVDELQVVNATSPAAPSSGRLPVVPRSDVALSAEPVAARTVEPEPEPEVPETAISPFAEAAQSGAAWRDAAAARSSDEAESAATRVVDDARRGTWGIAIAVFIAVFALAMGLRYLLG